jgi:predicted porin
MKKSLIALAVMSACAGTAYADDSTLTLYGILDVSVYTLNHSSNFNQSGFAAGTPAFGLAFNQGATSRATGILPGGESASRWGIRGSEDMGNGMKAFFQLESGISTANGQLATTALENTVRTGVSGGADTALNGQLFGRAAYMGVSNAWGALSLGRVTSFELDTIGRYDPVNAQMFSPINFSGTYGGGGATDNSRVDSAVRYIGKWDAFNLGLIHKFGGIAGSSGAGQVNEINAGWEQGPFGVQAAFTKADDTTLQDNNGVTVAGVDTPYPAGSIGVTWVDIRSYMLAAKWQATSNLTLKAIYEYYDIGNPSNPTVDATITSIYGFPIGHVSLSPLVAGGPDRKFNTYVIGANYDFTGAWRGSVGYYHVTQNDYSNGSTTVANMGKLSGTDNYASGMLEYKFSKRTNAYTAFMYNKKTGGVANAANGTTIPTLMTPTGITSYLGIGLGLRHVF